MVFKAKKDAYTHNKTLRRYPLLVIKLTGTETAVYSWRLV